MGLEDLVRHTVLANVRMSDEVETTVPLDEPVGFPRPKSGAEREKVYVHGLMNKVCSGNVRRTARSDEPIKLSRQRKRIDDSRVVTTTRIGQGHVKTAQQARHHAKNTNGVGDAEIRESREKIESTFENETKRVRAVLHEHGLAGSQIHVGSRRTRRHLVLLPHVHDSSKHLHRPHLGRQRQPGKTGIVDRPRPLDAQLAEEAL